MSKNIFQSYTQFALSNRDYQKLLDACKSTEDTCLIEIACELGLRRADIVSIRLADIDIQNRKLSFMEHKKGKIRTMAVPQRVMQNIQKHINTLGKTVWLFPERREGASGHLSGMFAWRILQRLCQIAEIANPPGRTARPFHSLRGTCYKLKQNRDHWNVNQAAAWLGDTPETAMLHYGKTTDAELENLISEDDHRG